MASNNLRKIDHSGLKTGQAITIILLLVGFVLDSWLIILFVGISQLMGALALSYAPYRLLYEKVVLPTGIVKRNVQVDNSEPHRFAMLVGSVFNGLGAFLIATGSPVPGFALVWIVIALANLNFWLNFCLGCWMYYQFNRLGIPGFSVSPIQE